MLSPWYDLPQTRQEVEKSLSASGVTQIRRHNTEGLNLVGQRG
jgi:hypothetical protein